MSKFKVGDIVKGKINAIYMITNEDMIKGKIIRIRDDEFIDIQVIEHKKNKKEEGSIFRYLKPKYFELIKNKEN